MALQLTRGTTHNLFKIIASSFAIMAFVLQPLVSLNMPSAFALGGSITINDVAGLCSAINNQADGQTWNIRPGHYGIAGDGSCNSVSAGGQTGWYLPITVNNLTINGIGNPTLYGSDFSKNGAWAKQDFVAIFGDNVTIKNLTLMSKIQANKAIEVMGNNSTIENVAIKHNTLVDQSYYNNPMQLSAGEQNSDYSQWNGSIYYNDDSTAPYNNHQTTQTLKNVTIDNGGVSIHAPNATINATNVHLVYRSNVDWINEYRFYKPYSSTVLNGTPTYTYQVSHALNNIDTVLAGAVGEPSSIVGPTTVKLISDLWTNHQLTLNADNVTINGAKASGNGYYTLYGAFDTPIVNGHRDDSNNSVLAVQNTNGVRIRELNIDGQNHQLHGINVYQSTDVQTWRVTVKNNGFSGLNVNGSWVQGVDLSTVNNGWHGVDIDKTGAFFQSAGINHHNENQGIPDLYIDDLTFGQVNDKNNQYVYVNNYLKQGDRAYFLKANVPTIPNVISPLSGTFTTSVNLHKVEWGMSTDGFNTPANQMEYEYRLYTVDPAANPGATIRYQRDFTGQTFNPAQNTPQGTYWWRVRACNPLGLCSDWTAPQKFIVDNTAPTAPTATPDVSTNFNVAQAVALSSTDTGSGIDKIYYTTDGTTPSSANGTAINSGDTVEIKLNGTKLKAIAYDKAGNASSVAEWVYVIAPLLTVNPIIASTDTTPTITGTTNGVSVTVGGLPATLTGGVWSFTPTVAYPVGTTNVNVVSTDVNGNTTSQPVVVTVTAPQQIDNGVPAPVVVAVTPTGTQTTGGGAVANGDVQGAEDSKDGQTTDKAASVMGAENSRGQDKTDSKAKGLSWLWWLVLAAAVITFFWLIAARRRKKDQDA